MRNGRSFLIPEVLQTSLMDCGPAALKAVLEGLGIEVHYEWLRDRCETDVDGTSIDSLARLGRELGLDTDEMVVPHDNFLLPEARCLPAIVVKRVSSGGLHFVVVWRMLGPFLQILDPGSGRRWVKKASFLQDMPHFPIPITIARWRKWAGSPDALAPLRRKLHDLGVGRGAQDQLIARADASADWRPFAALDAGVRMVTSLCRNRAVVRGRECEQLLTGLLDRAAAGDPTSAIPRGFWWVTADKREGKLLVHGPVIVHFESRAASAQERAVLGGQRSGTAPRFAGRRARPSRPSRPRPVLPPPEPSAPEGSTIGVDLPASVKQELARPSPSPERLLWQLIRNLGRGSLALIGIALVASAAVAALDVVLLQELPEVLLDRLALPHQRSGAIVLLVAFVVGGLALEVSLAHAVSRVARAVEIRVRAAFLQKLPLLEDRYLRSRPTSDMTARGHAMHLLREAPQLMSRVLRAGLSFVATVLGILWLHPQGTGITLAAAAIALAAPFAARRSMVESLMRLHTHAASLERFYLDALLGVMPVRAHGAERSVRREHEALLVEWARAGRRVHAQTTGVQALQALAGTGAAAMIVAGYVAAGGPIAGFLLLVFWSLRLPVAAQELAAGMLGWRNVRNIAVRLFAPLSASELRPATQPAAPPRAGGVELALRAVTVQAGGHPILSQVSLSVPAGAQLAIVGPSGAGKSSLLSLFLGWIRPASGELLVDGHPVDDESLTELRATTAWVDPAVHLWNASLYQNVTFGAEGAPIEAISRAVAESELPDVLERLPGGLQGPLGEGGARVSGGQGQRVRLARALVRQQMRLVLLDEPFRGLERERRRALMQRARQHWAGATMLFVSHDVSDTLEFDRVLVVDGGTIVEDGTPGSLLADPQSRYRALYEADARARQQVWSSDRWRKLRVEGGRLLLEPSP